MSEDPNYAARLPGYVAHRNPKNQRRKPRPRQTPIADFDRSGTSSPIAVPGMTNDVDPGAPYIEDVSSPACLAWVNQHGFLKPLFNVLEISVFRTKALSIEQECCPSKRCTLRSPGCAYAHSYSRAEPRTLRRNPYQVFYKHLMCTTLHNGNSRPKTGRTATCPDPELCSYAHSKEEQSYHPSVFKTEVCDTVDCSTAFCPFLHESEFVLAPDGTPKLGFDKKPIRRPPYDGYPYNCADAWQKKWPSVPSERRSTDGSINDDLLSGERADPWESPTGFPCEMVKRLNLFARPTGLMSPLELSVFRTQKCSPKFDCEGHGGTCWSVHNPGTNSRWLRRNPYVHAYRHYLCVHVRDQLARQNGGWQSCQSGIKCDFAHSYDEQMYHPHVYKTADCKHIPCTRTHCPFVHANELVPQGGKGATFYRSQWMDRMRERGHLTITATYSKCEPSHEFKTPPVPAAVPPPVWTGYGSFVPSRQVMVGPYFDDRLGVPRLEPQPEPMFETHSMGSAFPPPFRPPLGFTYMADDTHAADSRPWLGFPDSFHDVNQRMGYYNDPNSFLSPYSSYKPVYNMANHPPPEPPGCGYDGQEQMRPEAYRKQRKSKDASLMSANSSDDLGIAEYNMPYYE